MILQDYLAQGMPWAESRKVVLRSAPESCRAAIQKGGAFYESAPFSEMERGAGAGWTRLEDAAKDIDAYIMNPRSGMKADDERLLWYAHLSESGGVYTFNWMDLREFQIKILFQRRFASFYHGHDEVADQVGEALRYYNRALHTFRRMKSIRWIKIAVRNGLARIYSCSDSPDGNAGEPRLILERSYFTNRRPECELLDSSRWEDAPEHIKKRIDFWRLEETGALDDETVRNALHSGDDVLVSWAIEKLRSANYPFARDTIKSRIESDAADDAKSAIRAAGRLWLSEFESVVMRQYSKIGNPIGPAVADYIGAIGVTGRSFLPTILNTLARRGDFATLISVIRALGVFPYSKEFKTLPKTLALMMEAENGLEKIESRFPGVASDLRGGLAGRELISAQSIEALRAEAVNAIIQTTAMTADDETFAAVAGRFDIASPFFPRLLEEIEINLRTDASEYLLARIKEGGEQSTVGKRNADGPRRSVLAARALMRTNKPEARTDLLARAISLMLPCVESYRQDSALKYCFHIENYPSEPHISLRSIIKGLPDEKDISDLLLQKKTVTDKEKFLIHKISGEG